MKRKREILSLIWKIKTKFVILIKKNWSEILWIFSREHECFMSRTLSVWVLFDRFCVEKLLPPELYFTVCWEMISTGPLTPVNSGEERTRCRSCWTSDLAGTCGEWHSWTGGRLDGRGRGEVEEEEGGLAVHAWLVAPVPLTRQLNYREREGGREGGNGWSSCFLNALENNNLCS